MYTPVMCDFTPEDRYWIEQEVSRKEKEAQRPFFFLPKIEVLSRTSLRFFDFQRSVKRYVELACMQELSKEATGEHLNGCASFWVFILA